MRILPAPIILSILLLRFLALPVDIWGQKEIRLEIYPSTDRRIPIGIERFNTRMESEGLSREISGLLETVLERDLQFSLYFRLIEGEEKDFGSGAIEENADLKIWKENGARFLIKGEISGNGNDLRISTGIHSIWTFKEISSREYRTNMESLRWTLHRIADDIIEVITGEKGVSQTRIAYVVEKGGVKELYLMDYDGYNLNPLTRNESIVLSPAWSPDGEKIVFTSYRDNNPNLYLKNLKNGKDEPLLSFPGINSAPAWSPEGRYLAVTLSKDGASEVYRYDYKSSVLRRLTYNISIDTSPSWSPNGKQIVFTSDRAGNPHIYIMDSDGSNLRRLTTTNPYNDTPIWSPLGDKVAFVSRERGESFDIYTLDILSGRIRQLTAVGNNTHPSWSPDGLHIIFSSNRDRQDEIYIMNWDGTGLRRLTYNGGNTSPAWSPRMKWYKGGDGK